MPHLYLFLSFLLSLSLSLLYFFLPILSFSLSLLTPNTHTHKMTKRASPSPPTRMRATTASRHVARTFSGKPDVMIDQYNLPEHITPPCSLRRFTFFKDRNKLADATRSGSMAACMRCSVRCWRPKRAYLLSEQAPMKLRCRMRWRKAVLNCALVALTLRFGSHSPSSSTSGHG